MRLNNFLALATNPPLEIVYPQLSNEVHCDCVLGKLLRLLPPPPTKYIVFFLQTWRGFRSRLFVRRLRAALLVMRNWRRYRVRRYIRELIQSHG